MVLRRSVRKVKGGLRQTAAKIERLGKRQFECPICAYAGPFADIRPSSGLRRHAQCPDCGSLERHRLQYLVTVEVLRDRDASQLRMLHFAPEPFLREYFSRRFGEYETADLAMHGVDYHVDLQALSLGNSVYDFVFASHVLEHVSDDTKAIYEIRRILKPGGVAILPVPLVSKKTIEYAAPNPHEACHVRAPGRDYYDRYEQVFSRVREFASDSFPDGHQLYVYEDRSQWPTAESPLREAMQGKRHIDIVPVCYA